MSERYSTVFDALFDDKSESENLRIRSKLMIEICKFISDNNMSQTAAANLMRVSQPRISDIKQGKINNFTIDSLVSMLAYAGLKIGMEVIEPKSASHRSKTTITHIEGTPWPRCAVIQDNFREKWADDYGLAFEDNEPSEVYIYDDLANIG